jgi:hypothetical protein
MPEAIEPKKMDKQVVACPDNKAALRANALHKLEELRESSKKLAEVWSNIQCFYVKCVACPINDICSTLSHLEALLNEEQIDK